MDFELDATQQSVLDLARKVFADHAGPARARVILASSGYDRQLATTLDEVGLSDLAITAGAGTLPAELVVEEASRAAAVLPMGARALVAPQLGLSDLAGPVAILEAGGARRARFAAQAPTYLVVGDRDVEVFEGPGGFSSESIRFGFPLAEVTLGQPVRSLPGQAGLARRWWRVAIAAEVSGCAGAALDLTVNYLKERRQFGQPIAAFQAVQHRLAALHVDVSSTTWLARYAAWHGAREEDAAAAAACAAVTAQRSLWELHQLHGAIGFTVEYDLQLWTMRLQVLRSELGGAAGAHAVALAEARWFAGTDPRRSPGGQG